MNPIYKDLYRFTSYVEPINLSFNQYLLLTDEPLLIHTGSKEQALGLIPKLKEILAGKELAYIFISHFESDECGGLTEILTAFPNAKVICSEVTGRQLGGFGLVTSNVLAQKGETKLNITDCELEFITYPSEMHLWDGLLLIENNRKILFSSDLVFRLGKVADDYIESGLDSEIEGITHAQIPDSEKRNLLQSTLKAQPIDFIAAGHGACVKIKGGK